MQFKQMFVTAVCVLFLFKHFFGTLAAWIWSKSKISLKRKRGQIDMGTRSWVTNYLYRLHKLVVLHHMCMWIFYWTKRFVCYTFQKVPVVKIKVRD